MLFIALLTLLSPLALTLVRDDVVLWVYLFGLAQLFMISAALDEAALSRTRTAISLYGLCLAAISIVSYSHSITIGTPGEPYLAKSDGQGYFAEAMLLLDGNIFDQLNVSRTNYLGYQFILASGCVGLQGARCARLHHAPRWGASSSSLSRCRGLERKSCAAARSSVLLVVAWLITFNNPARSRMRMLLRPKRVA